MAHFIEFTTSHNERTYSNPVHDGKRPKRFTDVTGLRVNGDLIHFKDESIPLRVQRYLLESRQLQKRRIANDCVAFVAHMKSIELKDPSHNPFADFDADTTVDRTRNTSNLTEPLLLARGFHDGVRVPVHVILPAHLVEVPNFLHKLGDDRPLCMSNLDDAMKIMGCTTAHPVLID